MKMLSFILLGIFLNYTHAQITTEFCNLNLQTNSYIPVIPVTGSFRILVVLSKFQDDNFNKSPQTNLWPSSLNSMPSWAQLLVSQSIQSNYPDPTLSGYFQDMSQNQFNIIGDVVFYQPIHEESYYFISSGKHIGYLTAEILTGINQNVNYANYDNWDPEDYDSDGIKNEPDGKVDFIAICFRFANTLQLDGSGYAGIAGLTGFRQNFGSYGDQLVLDGKIILASNLLGGLSSGTFQSNIISLDQSLHIMAHELGHYLFGTIHYEGVGNHGLMDGQGTGVMSSFERIRMNWLQPINISGDSLNTNIPPI